MQEIEGHLKDFLKTHFAPAVDLKSANYTPTSLELITHIAASFPLDLDRDELYKIMISIGYKLTHTADLKFCWLMQEI